MVKVGSSYVCGGGGCGFGVEWNWDMVSWGAEIDDLARYRIVGC